MEYHTLNGSRIRLTAERDTTMFTFSVVMVVSLVTALVAVVQVVSLVIGD
jgi:hypothetical protein